MSQHNPYAAPQTGLTRSGAESLILAADGGLWRKGRLLVMHKEAPLPDRCIKSNQPAFGRRLKRKLNWHHPGAYVLIFLSVLIYVIVALIITKRATIHIGLSEAWHVRRRTATIIGWSLVLVGVGAFVVGFYVVDSYPLFVGLIALGVIGMLGGAIYGLVAARMVAPTRIAGDYVWLKGAHPDFLRALPDWPHQP